MSAYKKFDDIQFRDLELLKKALHDLGFAVLEEGENLQLYGYQGDLRPERAQLVIRREQLTSASNDLGFVRTEKGYAPVVSEYDERILLEGKFLPKLRTAYSLRVVEQVTQRMRGTAIRTQDGSLIKIRVRY